MDRQTQLAMCAAAILGVVGVWLIAAAALAIAWGLMETRRDVGRAMSAAYDRALPPAKK